MTFVAECAQIFCLLHEQSSRTDAPFISRHRWCEESPLKRQGILRGTVVTSRPLPGQPAVDVENSPAQFGAPWHGEQSAYDAERASARLFPVAKCRSAPATPRHGSSALTSPRPQSSARSTSSSTTLFRGQPPWHYIIRRVGDSYVRTRWVKPEPPPKPAAVRHFVATPRNAMQSPIHACTQRSPRPAPHPSRATRVRVALPRVRIALLRIRVCLSLATSPGAAAPAITRSLRRIPAHAG